MGIKDFFEIIRFLFTSSGKVWLKLKEADYKLHEMFLFYLLPLLIAGSFAKTISLPEGTAYEYLTPNLVFFIEVFSYSLSLLVAAYLIGLLAPRYNSVKDFNLTFALISCSYTPVFLGSIITAIHPSLLFAGLAGMVYMLILFWRGVDAVLETPDQKKTGFKIICLLILFGSTVIAGTLVNYIVFYLTGNIAVFTQEGISI